MEDYNVFFVIRTHLQVERVYIAVTCIEDTPEMEIRNEFDRAC